MSEPIKFEYMAVDLLTPCEGNARKHGREDVEAIKASIREFGFDDPIGIWGEQNIIVEGHGRLLAAKELGLETVPVIRLDHLTDEQRRAYALAHNRTAELSGWDFDARALELGGIDGIDMSKFGFDAQADWFSTDHGGQGKQEGNEEYNSFVEKFEAKKTTDDCYTPPEIYKIVAEYVAKRYGKESPQFVRPFYPGGDYQSEVYGEGCVVVDNPPFSILSEIVDFYVAKSVKFFLFAPGVACMAYAKRDGVTVIPLGAQVTYENGAKVVTAFLTNLSPGIKCETCPELRKQIEDADKEIQKALHKQLPKYVFPYEVLTAARAGWLSKYGEELAIRDEDCTFIGSLDSMKDAGRDGIYGGALLLSERAAAERAAAERAAAESWTLSDREKEMVASLGGSDQVER